MLGIAGPYRAAAPRVVSITGPYTGSNVLVYRLLAPRPYLLSIVSIRGHQPFSGSLIEVH